MYTLFEVIIMPRKKKAIEPIVGPGKDPENKLTVQKAKPLFSLWRSDMTLAEFKILDTYLSRINSHYPDKRTVVFTKGELEQLLGVKKINKADLSARLNGLGRFVELEHSDKKIHKVALFEEAYGEMDEKGLWVVKLTCTDKAMKYVFNIEKLGYLRYKLRCITSLTSRYTYILFMYLEDNRYRKSWEVDVNELRKILNCNDDELYKEFKFFNQRILKRCQKELLEKSECRFEYEPIKKGRRVTSVRFTVETLDDAIGPDPELAQIPGQMTVEDFEEDEPMGFLALDGLGFSTAEKKLLMTAAYEVIPYQGDKAAREMQIHQYLYKLVQKLKIRMEKVAVPHPHAWLLTAIENDAAKRQGG